MPPVVSGPRGEDSLSSHLERLRLNAQAAKNGAQNGGVGAIGSRDGYVQSLITEASGKSSRLP